MTICGRTGQGWVCLGGSRYGVEGVKGRKGGHVNTLSNKDKIFKNLRSSHWRLRKKNFLLLLLSKCPNKIEGTSKSNVLFPKYPNTKTSLEQTGHTPKWQTYVPSDKKQGAHSQNIMGS